MKDISALCDKNGYIKIVALDHRDSLKKLIPENEIVDFKTTCIKAFNPYITAVLLDPEYLKNVGKNGVRPKIGSHPFLASLEKSGYTETPDGRVNTLYQDFSSNDAKKMGAVATKLLIYYNPSAFSKKQQLETAQFAYEESHKVGLPLLLEIVTYPYGNLPYRFPRASAWDYVTPPTRGRGNLSEDSSTGKPVVFSESCYNESRCIAQSVEELKDYGDIIKINFCEDLEILCDFVSIGKPWVLLSRGREYNSYKKCLQQSKDIGGAVGFAVGRSLWQEVGELKTWKEREKFIKTVAVSRLKELSDIF